MSRSTPNEDYQHTMDVNREMFSRNDRDYMTSRISRHKSHVRSTDGPNC